MRLLIEGINPMPWTAPQLGTKRVGGKVVPITFPKAELAEYQEAIHDTVASAVMEKGLQAPVFAKGTLLICEFFFWRQLESYNSLATGRKVTPKQPDVTNMLKATEDALQGVIYHNDTNNRVVSGHLVECGPEVEPRIMLIVNVARQPAINFGNLLAQEVLKKGTPDRTKTVWIYDGSVPKDEGEAKGFA